MQCPNCQHEATPEAFGEPARCPECGVYYAKALAHQQRRERASRESEPDIESSDPSLGEKLKRGMSGAISAVEEGRRQRIQQESAVKHALATEIARPVAVVDVQMPFSSMVWFMVKWAIASIPAIIILITIGVAAAAFVSGFTGAIGGPPRL